MITCKLLNLQNIKGIVPLVQELNPELDAPHIENNQREMFKIDSYRCFGLFEDDNLIGISSGWITVRHYSGKQMEIDNVIITQAHQSKGYGKQFVEFIAQWSRDQGCQTIELNTYVTNTRSHKFYYDLGFKILGFHFYKSLWITPR